jgi:hypothetical protein
MRDGRTKLPDLPFRGPASFILLGIMACALACASPVGINPTEGETMSPNTIQEALKTHNDELLSIPGVVGTAQALCQGTPCIRVMVSEKTPSVEQKILSILEGYPVQIRETGTIRPRPQK